MTSSGKTGLEQKTALCMCICRQHRSKGAGFILQMLQELGESMTIDECREHLEIGRDVIISMMGEDL